MIDWHRLYTPWLPTSIISKMDLVYQDIIEKRKKKNEDIMKEPPTSNVGTDDAARQTPSKLSRKEKKKLKRKEKRRKNTSPEDCPERLTHDFQKLFYENI